MPIIRTSEANGIIPARAGFTWASIEEFPWWGDHPRSRGVYCRVVAKSPRGGGSSPLARGLLAEDGGGLQEQRIIPARAGFTGLRVLRAMVSPDHPRSRGVYRRRFLRLSSALGSSPLARGLLVTRDDNGEAVRIIPARAGFTEVVIECICGW